MELDEPSLPELDGLLPIEDEHEKEPKVTGTDKGKKDIGTSNVLKKKSPKKVTRIRGQWLKSQHHHSTEEESDSLDSSPDEHSSDTDTDSGDENNDANVLSRSPLPFSAQKVDYVFIGLNKMRPVPCRHNAVKKGKRPRVRAAVPKDQGKPFELT